MAEIHIDEVVSTVRHVDGGTLSEGALKSIVQGVLNGLAEEERRRRRAEGDLRPGRGRGRGREEHPQRPAPDEPWPGARVLSVSITIYPDTDDAALEPGAEPEGRSRAKRDKGKKKR